SSTAPTNSAPTAVSLTNQQTAIAENTSTTTRIKVADVAITDDALGTNNLSVSGTDASFFEVVGNALYLKANTALNFEAKTSYSVTVNVDDSTVGLTPDATTNFILNVTNVNEAPTAVSLNNQVTAIAENTSTTNRIKVADIAITDDALGTNNLSVSGTDASVFEVVGTELYIKANTALNFEAKTSYNVTVNADDSTVGSTPDATTNFTLNVTNVNEAPVITSAATATFAENGTSTVYTVTATDPDAGTTLTYSLSGTDAALFNITNGAVTFKNAPNFESRTDGNSDNVYDINVIASDGALNTTKAVAITVTNVNEAPTVANAIANQTIAVNASLNYRFEANTFSDVDSDPLTYTVTLANGTALPSWLAFNGTTRTFSGTPTTPGNLDIKIVANDSNGGTIADEFQLSIVTPIVGTAANDSVFAISPAEIIDGAGGIDEVNYARSNSGVTIDLETGKGIGGYAQGDILTNIEKLTGSFYNDHLKGNAAYNYFYGGNGNDLLEAGSGGGFFYGENGNDTIYGGEGQDRLYGQTGNDLLDGKAGNDILLGGNDLDILFGGAGNDILYGDDGNDELTGTNSTAKGIGEIDILYGGSGSDTFILGNTANIFYDDGNPLNMGRTDYARIKDYNQAQDIIKLTNGKDYYLGGSPGGIVLGTSIFIDNDGIRGLTSRDELIANLEGTNLILGLITGSTQGFSFI
ncbi:putative Ig domain-containing protein, partial [Aphanizomenon sp. UHCC 0183]|uniref:putative Ig domain-containing protein n=1 Tax=Aphanizomenon sp. UHCC 0183 TaxID=2590028 RepID=UPI00157FF86E